MKIVSILFIIILFTKYTIVISSNTDIDCLANIFNKLFLDSSSFDICTGDRDRQTYYYTTTCNNGVIDSLIISSKSSTNTYLEYQDINCFSNLTIINLQNINIKKDILGLENDRKVADKVVIYKCKFMDGQMSTTGQSISKGITSIEITIDINSSLNSIYFSSIKYTKIFYFTETEELYGYNVNLINDILENDSNSFDFISISSFTVPVLKTIRSTRLNLYIYKASSASAASSFSNFQGVKNINTISLSFKEEIPFPVQLNSADNSFSSLYIYGPVKVGENISDYQIQPGLFSLSIINSPSFHINGKLPISSFPSSLKQLILSSIAGLTQFPKLPSNITSLTISNVNFEGQSLPDLSLYTSLISVFMNNCNFSGTIPESYCAINVNLRINSLSGYIPQCFICHNLQGSFGNNPNLITNSICEPDSIVPNLKYDSTLGILYLFGKNLGLFGLRFSNNTKVFKSIIPQTLFQYTWNISADGVLPDTITTTIALKNYILATKYISPSTQFITKLDNVFQFQGFGFSYNSSDFQVKISNTICRIKIIDYYSITCQVDDVSVLPIGQDVITTIQTLNEIITLTVNTAQNKKTQVIDCMDINKCGLNEGRGVCSSSTGQCICNQGYGGSYCSTQTPFLTSVSSTLTSGGVVNLYGWFSSDQYDALKVVIGSLDCKVHFVNSTFSNCTIGSGSGTLSVLITINSYTWTGFNMFHYIPQEFSCPKDCSSNGECNKSTGECLCFIGWAGFDCNSKYPTSSTTTTTSTTSGQTPKPDDYIPSSNTTIDDDSGSTIITNQETTYEISIISLVELDVNGQEVVAHNLTNKWISNSTVANNIHNFQQEIQSTTTTTSSSSCLITYTIEDIKEPRDYEFAGLKLTLDKDSIKITVSIENYPFTNVLNNLQLRIESSVDQSISNDNQCNSKDTEIDTQQLDRNQLLNYITISRNQKILYGRFLNRVLSDNRESFITTSLISNSTANTSKRTKGSIVIGLNLPHFTSSLIIDPDFSVLVSSEFKKCKSNERQSWILPVAIVVPCVALIIIVIITSIIYIKNRSKVLVIKDKLKLKSLSKRKKDELYMPNDPTRT